MTEREIIERAIELIHTQGWQAAASFKGQPTCLEYALTEAALGKRAFLDTSIRSLIVRRRLRKKLITISHAIQKHTDGRIPWKWNDCHTEDEVLALLKDVYVEMPL